MNEIWKSIKGYEGLYEISSLGRVKNLNYKGSGKEKILKNTECSNGYLRVGLIKNGKTKMFRVHRLVAEAFIPNPEGKPCIDHINTIRNDNRIENLRWVTYEENNNNQLTKKKMSENHREQIGENNHMYGRIGKNNPNSKPVVQIDPNTNEVVNIYFSTNEVAKQTGFNQGAISQCCNGKYSRLGNNIYKGFKWMYLEDYEKLN